MNKLWLGAAILLALSGTAAVAQNTGEQQGTADKPISAVPPPGPADHSVDTNTTSRTPEGVKPGTSGEGYAHNTGDVANGPTPPRQTGAPPPRKRPESTASSTIHPGPAYGHGTSEVGNSSGNNGVLGADGAGASATMQSGHSSNH